jgi:hypothetical protein
LSNGFLSFLRKTEERASTSSARTGGWRLHSA